MTNLTNRRCVGLLAAVALAVIPHLAIAQQHVPTREGNIWNGMDHEPTPSEVERGEAAAGITPPAAQQNRTTDEVESLYRQLMGKKATH